MRVTRRYWAVAAIVGVMVAWAIVLQQAILLVGTASIGAWLLVRQYRFMRGVDATIGRLTINLELDRSRVVAEETSVGMLHVTSERPAGLSVRVAVSPPTGATGETIACVLGPDENLTQASFEVKWPIAGRFHFDQPTVTVRDSLGLFRQSTTVGSTPSVTVEPRTPRDIHVGEGGNRLSAGFGEHEGGRTGSGLTPAEVRRYTPGDTFRRIDWKATARLDEPHIREFEAEQDYKTLLVVDHRATMGAGSTGRRKLDFARQVALALVESTRELGDPLACYTVGDEGVTNAFRSSSDDDQYRTVARTLRTLEPTTTEESGNGIGSQSGTQVLNPGEARRTAQLLSGETEFENRLRPFFADAEQYVQRIVDEPLFGAVRVASTTPDSGARTIIISDDEHRTELLETVKAARGGDGHVVAFITPSVLYDSGTLAEIDDAYRRYTEFEAFRRDLAAVSRVNAYEVGPADRLTTVLAAGNATRRAKQ
jgi:uncharacterized protein (DUF58 family)